MSFFRLLNQLSFPYISDNLREKDENELFSVWYVQVWKQQYLYEGTRIGNGCRNIMSCWESFFGAQPDFCY